MSKQHNYSDLLLENIEVVFELYGDELICDADKQTAEYQINTAD